MNELTNEELAALLQIVNAVSIKGSDARLIVGILDKLENSLQSPNEEDAKH